MLCFIYDLRKRKLRRLSAGWREQSAAERVMSALDGINFPRREKAQSPGLAKTDRATRCFRDNAAFQVGNPALYIGVQRKAAPPPGQDYAA
jgi:hypothetical protein